MKHTLKRKGHLGKLWSVSLAAGFPFTPSAHAVPVTILNGSFEEGVNPITTAADGGIAGKGIGYTTYDCVEWPDIQRDNKFDDTLLNSVNSNLNVGQPTGQAGRPRHWSFAGSVVQDNIATDSRWPGVWNSWNAGPTDGRTAIILDNRSWEGGVGNDQAAWITMKQTLSLNVGQLKALGPGLKLSFDAREREGNQSAAADDLDGDSFIKVYFEVNGVQDVAGTWETRFDATRKVRTFAMINGSNSSEFYAALLPGGATRDNPARNPAATVGPQNMDTFFATLDLSAYSDDSAQVTMVVHNSRFRDGAAPCPSGRVYMDNIRVEAGSDGAANPFRIVEITRTGNSVSLRFNSVPGRLYKVCASSDMVTWEELDDSLVGEAGSTTGFTELSVPEGALSRFYIVKQ